ncbi:uncharacterized protein F4817DRAFT_213905 [Daldinia loculata]|uniref:uncharacterized protein n=1 Tax=Daldinia loculata TaxID=103429 RepID=UPI0020C4AB6A|nr:uncharacterized protein F4817DRAFT_213905 [Daldinia loculata]KAI1650927.1 hypothetical protein F4817DRAFT_213905 [Daldinia loculata]
MPALPSTLLLNTIAGRDVTLESVIALVSNATNATNTDEVVQVICAWPVSGQYGPGSRVLYYVLVATCVFARKAEWLRNACLAAALIFPAVAALHGIVLAAVHVDTAVDMDIYGAFQFCSIGILAAPLSVRISRTYFENPGRNIIFLWTGIVLAGLLSLTVEFFRTTTSPCTHDESGRPIPLHDYRDFPYENAFCNLTCSIEAGPWSPLRQKATDEIYVIPAPKRLAFNAVTLLAAACCIPAVLSLVSMWNKILEINWKSRFGPAKGDQLIEGTNGATVETMSKVNHVVRLFLSTLEVPLFSAAVIAIIIFGELNFFSPEVSYQTEPMGSIGQWAPLVGTGLAALGSLYMLLAVDIEASKKDANLTGPIHHCNCSRHHFNDGQPPTRPRASSSLHSGDIEVTHCDDITHPEHDSRDSPSIQEINGGLFISSSHSVASPSTTHARSTSSNSGRETSTELAPTESRPSVNDIGNRRKVYNTLLVVSNYLGTASQDRFDDSEFKHGKAIDFPEIPAEDKRNPDLPRVREAYNHYRNEDESASIRPRAGSFAGSIGSRYSIEGSPARTRAISAPHPPSPVSRSSSPSPSTHGVQHSNTLPVDQSSFDVQSQEASSSTGQTRGRPRQRRDTLKVPVVHPSSPRAMQTPSPVASFTTITNNQGSPSIVISHDPDTGSAVDDIPVLNPPTIRPSEPDPAPQPKASPPP